MERRKCRALSASARIGNSGTIEERVEMTHRAEFNPGHLSGGQQQMVAVARAIVGKPEILLADEPTGNLDSKSSAGVMDLWKDLHRDGATVCLVTHDPTHVVDQADRSVELLDGRIVGSEARVAAPAP